MFKVGDYVTPNENIQFIDNKIYTVEATSTDADGPQYQEIRLRGEPGWHRASRFKLNEHKGIKAFIEPVDCQVFGSIDYTISDIGRNLEYNEFEGMTNHIATRLTTLPTDSVKRKDYPMLSGCLKYFPAALAGVALVSKLGNDKHNPGEPLHHARGKSTDQGDCIIRHLTDTEDLLAAFTYNNISVTKEMILNEANQLAWRALAYSQLLHERFGAPLAPGAKK